AAALAAGSTTLGATTVATRRPPGADLVDGVIRQSVCKWCFPDMSVEELAVAAKRIGLVSIELLGPDAFATLKAHDLVCAMVSGPGGITEGWNRPQHQERLIPAFEERIREVAEAGFPNVICFSGNRDGMDDEEGLENCVAGLQRILPVAERQGVTVCMELLNSKVNHPDYMCDR